jgi:glycosyltransferase involved in cell wall biosynthesis
MRAEIERLGLAGAVELLGKQPFEKLPDILNGADVLAVPSLWLEAFGQVTIEAMAAGVPVVTSDIGGSTEINVDGETGFVVPKGDAGALAEAITTLLKDEGRRERMGRAARQRAEENYSYDVLVNKFLDLMHEVQ